MSDYSNLIKRLREYSNARKGEIAELTREAADALERQKGEWIEDYNIINDTYHFHCSVCGDEEWGSREQIKNTRYCPNCGAKMRQGGDA